MAAEPAPIPGKLTDWRELLRTVFISRALDALEESQLVPERKVLYQFCARGHDVTQALLAQRLTGRYDAVADDARREAALRRSRPGTRS